MLPLSPSRRPILGLAVICTFLCTAPSAFAYSVSLSNGDSGSIVRWMTSSVDYHLHPDCSADLNTTVCLNEVRASFQQWESPSCTAINFQEAGYSSNLALTAIGYSTNGKNELAWIEGSQWYYGTYTLGVTSPVFYEDGEVIEADIVFNGYLQTWSTSGATNSTDVRNVAVHEIGHFFGLQHTLGGYSNADPPTMAPTADPTMKSQTPNADDLEGVCFLYPAGSWTCGSTDECPLIVDDGPQGEYYAGQLSCSGGLCGGVSTDIPEGTATIGDECVGDYDCVSPYFCQPLGNGTSVCAAECNPNNDQCPGGFECVPYSGSSNEGVCLEESGGGGSKKGLGEACSASSECQSGLCLNESGGAYCRQPCNSDSDCPAGQSCEDVPGLSYGVCVDSESQSTGEKATGEPCSTADECASNLCAGGDGLGYFCADPCQTDSDCPEGYVCYELVGGGGACFADTSSAGSKGVGDSCDYADDCASDMCVSFDGVTAFCTEACTANTDCPCGMACDSTSLGLICTPGPKVGCVPDGEPCNSSSECTSLQCWQGTCIQACTILQPNLVCGDGMACLRFSPDGPEGICAEPGPLPKGSSCTLDTECVTLFCEEGACAEPCNPFSSDTCPDGESCEGLGAQIGWCLSDPEPTPTPPDETDGPDAPGNTGDQPGDGSAAPHRRAGAQASTGCHTTGAAHGAAPTLFLCLLFLLTRRRERTNFSA